ncbi:hypothetical protein PMG71_07975 [Roseofilum sp. BLCC_M154]|uniref:Uncharacterized protein n=1 Tax=Roseofilum acuticapitatum BLCC-M154 TaxID=3022444 RepID=A0ABT7AR36_9CYAN|nr:hypothetical protein [Roseofilum acuticapitatum]MDJ1169359.1 hypothetical protein [Roseofilum acuticapitatum BLCC-M154]
MQTPISLLVFPLLLVNTVVMTPVPSSELLSLSVASESTEVVYGYGYERRGDEAPRGGTGRRRIMA